MRGKGKLYLRNFSPGDQSVFTFLKRYTGFFCANRHSVCFRQSLVTGCEHWWTEEGADNTKQLRNYTFVMEAAGHISSAW